jgi:transposase InsO family protein
MAWKNISKEEQRLDLVRQIGEGKLSISELCRRFRISRPTAYKWKRRYQEKKLRGLRDKSRRPLVLALQTSAKWLRRVRRSRQRHPTWGARKLGHELGARFGGKGLPSAATMSRWLKRWGLARGTRRRPRGPLLLRSALRAARRCHDLWTVDFKGWYRTANGQRVEPLTVRDLYSRYVLEIALLRTQSIGETRRAFARIFQKHGLPRRIRCDNGTPFGGGGPTGLTRLSAWWVKLGIKVEFITPGRPCENGAHEQFHRVYKAEVAARPERTLRAQQERGRTWLRGYNHQRPHEALKMKTPAALFKRNSRRLPKGLQAWRYPKGWERRWVKGNGEINRNGVRRYVGEAFVRDYVGLKPMRPGIWHVYFGPALVGELRENERGSIRMAKYGRTR